MILHAVSFHIEYTMWRVVLLVVIVLLLIAGCQLDLDLSEMWLSTEVMLILSVF